VSLIGTNFDDLAMTPGDEKGAEPVTTAAHVLSAILNGRKSVEVGDYSGACAWLRKAEERLGWLGEPIGEVVIGEGDTKGWTVVKWRADVPPIAVGTKLYTHPPRGPDSAREAQDAARFQYLQNCPPIEAQAYFWNYGSRTERRKAIDAALAALTGGKADER
jgi:hypothetical protein